MTTSTQPVFSLHYVGLNLKKGVNAATFEAFLKARGTQIPAYPGWQWSLLKGLRGERQEQYLMLYQAPSQADYDRYITPAGELTAEAIAFWQQRPEASALLEEWKNFATYGELPTLFSTFSLLAENRHSSLPPGPNFQPDAQPAVARVVGFHHLALRAGVTAADFDRFMIENVARIDDYPGWKFHMLKGTGGNRSEQYAVMLVIESLDSLNSFHPAMDVSTEKSLTFVKNHQESERMYDEWRTMASFSGAPQMYTDYLTIAGNVG
ncbi:hypothetical protein MXF26_10350 [Pantoea dispersa]|uniref:hypothetical protein n=1 Tax=Pantoea dispersa TaxID=59814 RepID=UPI002DC0482D|nr:hypothetical protein [Pantoea dispersa]MEB5836654.1 hypothetical protein [Pantoea dispersa]